MTPCKSPTHQRYAAAMEGLDISAGQLARDLAEVRARPYPTDGSRTVAILNEMEKAKDRIDWALGLVRKTTAEVDAHIDRGCQAIKEIEGVPA